MASGGLLIAQISDVHVGATAHGGELNVRRLDHVLERLCSLVRRPDLLLVTGDLADPDDDAPYRVLRERLERCPFPFHVCLGNHDSRESARRVFAGPDGPFFHYAIDAGDLRILVLDTLEEGRHGGAFCDARAQWLRARLSKAPDQPTLLVLHHPPIDTGIDWLTTSPTEPWLRRLDIALTGQTQVVAMLAGHVHRPIVAARGGVSVRVCPSVASPLALDLARLHPEEPDGRPLVLDGPPGFALHLWRDGSLVTHFDYVGEAPVLASFDERMQPFIRSIFGERS